MTWCGRLVLATVKGVAGAALRRCRRSGGPVGRCGRAQLGVWRVLCGASLGCARALACDGWAIIAAMWLLEDPRGPGGTAAAGVISSARSL